MGKKEFFYFDLFCLLSLPSNYCQNMALLPHFLIRLSLDNFGQVKMKNFCGYPEASEVRGAGREIFFIFSIFYSIF